MGKGPVEPNCKHIAPLANLESAAGDLSRLERDIVSEEGSPHFFYVGGIEGSTDGQAAMLSEHVGRTTNCLVISLTHKYVIVSAKPEAWPSETVRQVEFFRGGPDRRDRRHNDGDCKERSGGSVEHEGPLKAKKSLSSFGRNCDSPE